MGSPEHPSSNPRTVEFRDANAGFEARVRIDSDGMDTMTPTQREHMRVTVAMFTSALYLAVDPETLRTANGTTTDVLNHLRFRIGQVSSSMVEGTIAQDPEKISPSPATSMKAYSKELATASIKTQEGIAQAKERAVLYARSVNAIANTIENLKTQPQSAQRDGLIERLTEAMLKMLYRVQGVDEALNLIKGIPNNVPPDIKALTEHFGAETPES